MLYNRSARTGSSVGPTFRFRIGSRTPTPDSDGTVGGASDLERTNMAYVYILRNTRDDDFYIGSTINIQNRLRKHESGKVRSTKHRLPMRVVLIQECQTYNEARKIELKIKKLKRKDYIDKMVRDGYVKMDG